MNQTDHIEGFATRHRFGSTASDTLQALHKAADLELADEGGIAPLEDHEEPFEPTPLVDREPDGRVAAAWFVIALSGFLLGWVAVASIVSIVEVLR